MNWAALLARFDQLLPLAAKGAAILERHILWEGVALLPEELDDARAVGVQSPERVRLLCLTSLPAPTDPILKAAAAAVHFLTPATRGLALRHGIFIRSDCWRDRELIAHELVHTAQYERMGGIEPFLRQYLFECASIGYPAAPLEQEALAVASQLRIQAGDQKPS